MKVDKELRKCPVETTDAIGRTAIHIAALYNKVRVVVVLLLTIGYCSLQSQILTNKNNLIA